MRSKDTDYTYAVAKVRARENALLDRARLQRLAEASSFAECLKLLREAGYPSAEAGYEHMLAQEQAALYAFLREISPVQETFDIFLVRSDYHNLKVLLKAEYLGENHDDLLKDMGRFPPERMRRAVAERRFSDMPAIMEAAVQEAVAAFDKTGDPQASDMVLDRAAFSEMTALAEQSGSPFVRELIAVMVDLENIRTFERVRHMGKGYDFLRRAVVDGGTIPPEKYLADTNVALSDILAGTAYQDFDSTSIAALEKDVDNFLVSYMRKTRFVAFGIEPLVAYLLAKENELRQVRIILTGKRNDIPADVIKERLREVYV